MSRIIVTSLDGIFRVKDGILKRTNIIIGKKHKIAFLKNISWDSFRISKGP